MRFVDLLKTLPSASIFEVQFFFTGPIFSLNLQYLLVLLLLLFSVFIVGEKCLGKSSDSSLVRCRLMLIV